MIRFCKFLLAVTLVFIFIRATCGKPKPTELSPTPTIKIKDYVFFHNVSITYNGSHYFTINGGNIDYCRLNEYDKAGNFIETYDIELDGRTIFYNPNEEEIYVKNYGTDLYWVDSEFEEVDIELLEIFENENSSPAISPNGEFIYELVDGEVRVLEFDSGDEINTFQLSDYYDEHLYNTAIAASDKYLFVWGAKDEVLVYSLEGKYENKMKLPWDGYGLSLSYCNGMLWIAEDADASTEGGNGYWYGFKI